MYILLNAITEARLLSEQCPCDSNVPFLDFTYTKTPTPVPFIGEAYEMIGYMQYNGTGVYQ